MAPAEIRITPANNTPKERHAREVENLAAQCNRCKLWKPKTPTKDCDVRRKLVTQDSEVAWKHRHLFFNGNKCKMFKEK